MSAATGSLRRNISHLCAIAVAGVFLVAAYMKIPELDQKQFAVDIRNFHIMPDASLNLMAILLPWCEVGAAIALLFPQTRRAGAIIITAMLVTFICAVSYAALYKGYNINCGCFGHNSAKAGFKTLGLDVALLVGTYFAAFARGAAINRAFPVVDASLNATPSAAVI